MKRILFLGACEKSDLLIYTSKILATAGQKVLLVDATLAQRYFYSIPVIHPETIHTEYDGFDVIRSCSTFEQLQNYFEKDKEPLDYDLVIIDTDNPAAAAKWGDCEHYFVVTNFERYTVEHNISLMNSFFENREKELVNFELVIYPYINCNLNDNYPVSTIDHLPILWSEEQYLFLYEETDYRVRVNNQHENRVILRKLASQTRKMLMLICEKISGKPPREIKKAYRNAERGK